jgi:hypothetical protein
VTTTCPTCHRTHDPGDAFCPGCGVPTTAKLSPREELLSAIQGFAEEWKQGVARAIGSPGRTAVFVAMDRLEFDAIARGEIKARATRAERAKKAKGTKP